MTHGSVPKEQRDILGIGDNFIRLSIGLEEPEDLIADLDQALLTAVSLIKLFTKINNFKHFNEIKIRFQIFKTTFNSDNRGIYLREKKIVLVLNNDELVKKILAQCPRGSISISPLPKWVKEIFKDQLDGKMLPRIDTKYDLDQ